MKLISVVVLVLLLTTLKELVANSEVWVLPQALEPKEFSALKRQIQEGKLSFKDLQEHLNGVLKSCPEPEKLPSNQQNILRNSLELFFVYGAQPITDFARRVYDAIFPSEERFLAAAIQEGNKKSVQASLKRGARLEVQINPDIGTPLHIAVMKQNIPVLKALLSHPEADDSINSTNGDGRTPLIIATSHKNSAIVRLLLQRGARLDISDNEQETALSWAIRLNALPLLKQFINAGIQPESFNRALQRFLRDLDDPAKIKKLPLLKLFLKEYRPRYNLRALEVSVHKIELSEAERYELIYSMLKNGVKLQALSTHKQFALEPITQSSRASELLLNTGLFGQTGILLAFLITRAALLGWYNSAYRLAKYSIFSLDAPAQQEFKEKFTSYYKSALKQPLRKDCGVIFLHELTKYINSDKLCLEKKQRVKAFAKLLAYQKSALKAENILELQLSTIAYLIEEVLKCAIGQGFKQIVQIILTSSPVPRLSCLKRAKKLVEHAQSQEEADNYKAIKQALLTHARSYYNRLFNNLDFDNVDNIIQFCQ